jgi:hypothetical protein
MATKTVNKTSKPKYETFECVYTSGLLIEPSFLTALSLIFDKIYILNNIEFVIEFSKHYTFTSVNEKTQNLAKNIRIKTDVKNFDPFSGLNDAQRFTANLYLAHLFTFGVRYSKLLKHDVVQCSIFENNEPIKVELIKKGEPGEKNTYRVSITHTLVGDAPLKELNNMVNRGVVPILGYPHVELPNTNINSLKVPPVKLASILAIRSLNLILPQTKPASDETILEAREKLKDFLPPFWSSMLRLTSCYNSLLTQNVPNNDLERECDIIINTVVRPTLIDLNQKIKLERRDWFHKIVTPVTNGVKIFAAKPPINTIDLLTTSSAAGTNVSLDVIKQIAGTDSLKNSSGLTLLIQLDKYLRDNNS